MTSTSGRCLPASSSSIRKCKHDHGRRGEREETLTVSWASLEKRKEEFEDLVNRQIPQNTKDIATARSYGDLRENFEFKSAKEQQRVLMRRRAEAERDLSRARGTNFENPDTTQVSIGTVVTLRDTSRRRRNLQHPGSLGQRTRTWESSPTKQSSDRHSWARALGESAELPTETGTRSVTIVRHRALHKLGRSPRESSPAFGTGHRLNGAHARNLLATGRAKAFLELTTSNPFHCHVRYPHH